MIRGIIETVAHSKLELGKFYLDPGYGTGSTLFQLVRSGKTREGSPVEVMLVFSTENNNYRSSVLSLVEADGSRPLVEMPQISVRVDPPSASGTLTSHSLNPGMIIVDGKTPILVASTGYSSWVPIDMMTGHVVRPSNNWVSFSRWSLVVDEAGEEIVIASFGNGLE